MTVSTTPQERDYSPELLYGLRLIAAAAHLRTPELDPEQMLAAHDRVLLARLVARIRRRIDQARSFAAATHYGSESSRRVLVAGMDIIAHELSGLLEGAEEGEFR